LKVSLAGWKPAPDLLVLGQVFTFGRELGVRGVIGVLPTG
jgi:hypothetical protein